MSLSRREFIKTTSAGTVGVVLYPKIIKGEVTTGIIKNPVCIFTKCLQFLDYDHLGETLALTGFDGADLSVRKGGHVLPENVKTDLPGAVKALQRSGITVPMMVTAITDPDNPETEQILGTASELGIKFYRMGYLTYDMKKSIQENLDIHRKTFEKLEKINRKFNIHGGYQNHPGTRVGSPLWDLYMLLKDTDQNYIGAQYDIGQAVMEGFSSWTLNMKLLSPWIKTTAIKDFIWQENNGKWEAKLVGLGEGLVDFDAYLKNYIEFGISGPITIHYEYDLGGAESGIKNPNMNLDQIIVYLKDDLNWLRKKLNEFKIR